MTNDGKNSGSVIVGGLAVAAIPAIVGGYGTATGMSVEQVGEFVVKVGLLPALMIVGFWATATYVKRKDDEAAAREERQLLEARRREDHLSGRVNEIENRYHEETVALAKRSIGALEKNTEAFRDLHQEMRDQHQKLIFTLTKQVSGGTMGVAGELVSRGEVEMMADKMKTNS